MEKANIRNPIIWVIIIALLLAVLIWRYFDYKIAKIENQRDSMFQLHHSKNSKNYQI